MVLLSIVLLFALQRFATGLILAPPTFGFVRGQRAATRLCSQSLPVVHVSCSRAAPTADPVPVVSTPVEPEASREHKRSRPARSTPSHLEAGPIALSWAAGGLTLLLQHHFTDWTQVGADAAYLSQRLQDVGVGPLPQPDLQVASRLGKDGIGFYIVDNSVTNIYVVAEAIPVCERVLLNAEKLSEVLEPGGSLSRIYPDYRL